MQKGGWQEKGITLIHGPGGQNKKQQSLTVAGKIWFRPWKIFQRVRKGTRKPGGVSFTAGLEKGAREQPHTAGSATKPAKRTTRPPGICSQREKPLTPAEGFIFFFVTNRGVRRERPQREKRSIWSITFISYCNFSLEVLFLGGQGGSEIVHQSHTWCTHCPLNTPKSALDSQRASLALK